MTTKIVMDVTRLLSRGLRASPTGIDRVELAYLGHFLAGEDYDVSLVQIGALGARVLNQAQGRALYERTARNWGLQAEFQNSGGAFTRVLEFVESDFKCNEMTSVIDGDVAESLRTPRKLFEEFVKPLSPRARHAARKLMRGGFYVNVAHSNLNRPALASWLRRTGLRSVFLIHDLIPITHPEYCRDKHDALHRKRMDTVLRFAHHVIANSQMTKDEFLRFACARSAPPPEVSVAFLGIESVFREFERLPDLKPGHPYFVVLGTIEPRKNHLLLLNVWRDLVERYGDQAPRLVIIGRRGWENENILDMLDRCPALEGHVLETGKLSDKEVAALMRSANGVLVPSFVEGFSLPVVEALCLGAHVIASDIQVHREVGGEHVKYLSPIDGVGWRSAIMELAAQGPSVCEIPQLEQMTWPAHFSQIDEIFVE